MNWIDAIKEIKKAQENNRLVIFVGAGVSKNSGYPLWGDLIAEMAKELGYEHCSTCRKNCEFENRKEDCDERDRFTQEEYLRIPEYIYDEDKSKYKKIIDDLFNIEAEPNALDEEILNVFPHHIITTNYDQLLERTHSINRSYYKVVAKDKDLLSGANARYIIKMHGDINDTNSLVLKESDYINYEQDYILISTFIKSLLIDHTFLFLGYSLNDINLNLIIGWINYFTGTLKVEQRPKSFLLSSEEPSKYEMTRLGKKDIAIVNISKIPEGIIKKNTSDEISNQVGKAYLTFLRLITKERGIEEITSLSERINDGYRMLADSYYFIAHRDLLKVVPLGAVEVLGSSLGFYNENEYIEFLKSYKENEIVRATISKTGLTEACLAPAQDNNIEFIHTNKYENDIWEDYFNFDYVSVQKKANEQEDLRAKLYFSVLLGEEYTAVKEIVNVMKHKENSNAIAALMDKMAVRLSSLIYTGDQIAHTENIKQIFNTLTPIQEKATTVLRELFYSNSSQYYHMQEILDDHKKHYQYHIEGFRSAHAHHFIWKLQKYAYDYYMFTKMNYIPVERFLDSKRYYSYYVQAILCSYSPVKEQLPNDSIFGITHREPYVLSLKDLDIIVRHTRSKDLRKWLKCYHVANIRLRDKDKSLKQYKNLCASYGRTIVPEADEYIYNYSIIIARSEIGKKEKTFAFRNLVKAYVDSDNKNIEIRKKLLMSLFELAEKSELAEEEDTINILANAFIDNLREKGSTNIEHYYIRVIRLISKNVGRRTKDKIKKAIEKKETAEEKAQMIYQFRSFFPRTKLSKYLNKYVDELNTERLFYLVAEGILEYDEKIEKNFINRIDRLYRDRKKHPNQRTFPDTLAITIERFAILALIVPEVDISVLNGYADVSPYISFMINPGEYDYSQIDTADYMWINIARNKKYKKYFKEHKKAILDQMKNAFDSENETRDQQKLAYGMLLSENDLWNY